MNYAVYTDSGDFHFVNIDESILEDFKKKYSDHLWRFVAIPKNLTQKNEVIKEARATIYCRRPSLADRTTKHYGAYRCVGSLGTYRKAQQKILTEAIMPTITL